MPALIKNINKKFTFWLIHLFGWFLYASFYFFPNRYRINYDNNNSLYLFLFILIISFLSTTLIRYFYRFIYAKKLKLHYYVIIVFLTSFCLGLLIFFSARTWTLSEEFKNQIGDLISHYDSFIYMKGWLGELFLITMPIFTWSTIYFGIKFWFGLQSERERLNEVKYMAKEAELQMLRYQINPHFLFNTLNSIQGLMHHKAELADKMLTELSEFLRYTLSYNQLLYVPLRKEIEIIEKYFLIEKLRFGEQLNFRMEIEPETMDLKVLCFLLQPLIENAIKYGEKTTSDKPMIIFRTSKVNRELCLEVRNTGKLDTQKVESGTGISNVKERLRNAYQNKHSFEIYEEAGWVIVIIKIHYSL